MATFVLVHGAWHGSWCWKRVRKALQAEGHDVFTPTLTGVGERSHLISPQVNLDTHVDDVVNLIRWEELDGRRAVRPLVRRLRDHGRRGPRAGSNRRARLSRCVRPRGRPACTTCCRAKSATAQVKGAATRRRLAGATDHRRILQRQRGGSRLGGPPMHAAAACDVPAAACGAQTRCRPRSARTSSRRATSIRRSRRFTRSRRRKGGRR